LNDKQITIRVATPADAKALLRVYAPYVLNTAITYEYEVPDEAEFAERIRRILQKYPYLVAECDGEAVGYAYASTFIGRAASEWSVETSIYISADCRRMGIGGRLYTALEAILKMQNILNLNASIACSPGKDDRFVTRNSVNFHNHMGFRTVGEFDRCGFKFGRWYDLIWMEKHIGEHTANPLPVRKFDDVRDEVREKLGIE